MLEKQYFNAEILLCEDSAFNTRFITEQLARLGIKTTPAENGRIGVEFIKSRIEKGEELFDMIFMDIHMPVMDGLEAAAVIGTLNVDIPIVAMTANVTHGELELYRTKGMFDCLGKPFTTQELWNCLLKHLTPVSKPDGNDIDKDKDAEELQKKLSIIFAQENQSTYKDILKAMNDGELKLAYRLAHTLKGAAGLIGKPALQKAAGDVEDSLKNEKNLVTEGKMRALQNELDIAMAEFAPLLDEFDKKAVYITEETTAGSKKDNSILIVEDEKTNLMYLVEILGTEYDIYTAVNGDEALAKANELLPDLILLDIVLPVKDGYEVIEGLKNSPRTKKIPVIFISGLSDKDEEEKGLFLGAADYISKPISPAIVKLRVRNQIQIQNLIRTIETLSTTDQLTGIPNRRSFDIRLDLEWGRAIRENTYISAFIIDIDKFKVYNDTYGHLQGDVALKKVARSIVQSLKRPADFAARLGGEEFVVLLPGTDSDGAVLIAEQIRADVEAMEIPGVEDTFTKATVSIGINTEKPGRDSSCDKFIGVADKELYRAKNGGRNRVCRPE